MHLALMNTPTLMPHTATLCGIRSISISTQGPRKPDVQRGGAFLFSGFSPAFLILFLYFSYTFLILFFCFLRKEKRRKDQEKTRKDQEKTRKDKKRQEIGGVGKFNKSQELPR